MLPGLVERLRNLGKRVGIISQTHSAPRRAGGVTADYYVRNDALRGRCPADYVWIDEIGQLDLGCLSQLNKPTHAKVESLISGDFEQFPPLCNHWR